MSSLTTYELSESSQSTPVFEVSGSCEMLIQGDTPCVLERSLGDSGFFPVTDNDGFAKFYPATNVDSGVIFNGTLMNKSQYCKFRVSLDSAALSPSTDVKVTIAKGW